MSDSKSGACAPLAKRLLPLMVLVLAACATPDAGKTPTGEPAGSQESQKAAAAPVQPAPLSKAQTELAAGVASYENGAYKQAERQLQGALSQGLAEGAEQARAYKYLAFIHCVDGRKKLCASDFAKALAADREFNLTAAEAGHPIWGPVFRAQKKQAKSKEKSR